MTFPSNSFNQPFTPGVTAPQGAAVFGNAPIPGYKQGQLFYTSKALNKYGYSKPGKSLVRGGAIIALSNWITRTLDKGVTQKESVMGRSHTRFVQDTATVLGGKLTAIRSAAEAAEAFFLEFVESALFYYSVPFIGQGIRHVWHGLLDKDGKEALHNEWLNAARASQVGRDIDKIREANNSPDWKPDANKLRKLEQRAEELIAKGIEAKHFDKAVDAIQTTADELGLATKESFNNISKGKKALVGLKGATIFSVLSVVVMEYALNFVKNLMTLEVFNQGDFTDVVNLTQGEHRKKHEGEHPTETKAKRWIRNCALISAGILAASVGLITGRNKQWVYNINRKLVKTFDFDYAYKMNKMDKVGKKWFPKLTMGLGDWQMRLIIILGGLGYLHAARDELEFKENFFRVQCVVVPYLAFGQTVLENAYARLARAGLFGSKTKASFEQLNKGSKKVFEGNGVSRAFQWLLNDDYKQKSHDDIVQEAFNKAGVNNKYKIKEYFALLTGQLEKNQPELAKQMKADLKKVMPHYKPLAVAKNKAFIFPFLFGVGVVGSGVAWMNVFWTDERFAEKQEQKAKSLFQKINVDRHGVIHQQVKQTQEQTPLTQVAVNA